MRQTPSVLCLLNSATCCMTNVLLSTVAPRSLGTCTGFYLSRRMLKVKSRQGEQSVLLTLKQRDASTSDLRIATLIKRRGWINRIRYGHNRAQARGEGPGKQMDRYLRKRNKTSTRVHARSCIYVCGHSAWRCGEC